MAKLRWKSASCTDRALQFMEVALQRVEEEAENAAESNGADDKARQKHIPTLINDLLYPKCIAVAVTPNVGEGACFRGMQCAQYSVLGKVYNIAVIMKPEEILANGEPDSTERPTA
ncbi:hypothetical protein BESB_016200 [Besnoitia besnoiti]|uniref:Uncharacterized protein n=1 Tax=Besnoitia besnoiti TaxID=94643 RepID=A0A2A9MA82_BESBE|nr:hypothetical protein BESB_016200 [Besnoitia besnoiti]PFH32302.1 hypothetical protein BESB_016200 [Besnoitia besnoiti]